MKLRVCLLLVATIIGCGGAGPARDLEPVRGPDVGGAPDGGRGPDEGLPDVGSPPDAGGPDGGAPGACAVMLEPGPCDAAFPRFTFDPASGRCVPVVWGGCGDNPNNFDSLSACELACRPDAGVCGGLDGVPCRSDEVCDYPDDGCGAADGPGICRPRPEGCPGVSEPVCGCDGRTYGNLCEAHGAGVDVARAGPCEGDGSCSDQSRDTMVVEALRTFGFCRGPCVFRLLIAAADMSRPRPCDAVRLEIRSWDRGPPLQVNAGVLTPLGHAQVRERARALVGVALASTYGCPGCSDGGIASLWLERQDHTTTVAYELGTPPEVLEAADELTQGHLIDALLRCESNPWLEVEGDCRPFR